MDCSPLTPPELEEQVRQPQIEPEEEAVVNENVLGPELRSPSEVFPHLVWLEISSQVEDTKDWLNLHSTSSELMGLLEGDKMNRVFPFVAPLLCQYLARKDVINLCATNRNIASNIISWVKMRCLSPSWAMDLRRREGGDYEDMVENRTSEYSLLVVVGCREEMELVTTELLEGGADSLIPFGITFRDRNSERVEYWERVKTFLQLFGNRIWFCKLFLAGVGVLNPPDAPETINQCLRLIRNVIRLELVYEDETPIPIAHPSIFPHLEKLKILLLALKTQEMVLDFLRLHADQLEYFFITGKHTPVESFRYSKLKMLHIANFIEFPPVPGNLDSFVQVPISKLFMDISANNFAEFGERFLQFNHFGGTLEILEFSVDMGLRNDNDNEEAWADNIRLPKLKKLGMWYYKGGLGFLQGIPSLEHLTFQNSNFANDGIIQLDWGTKEVFESNIWTLLKNLQTVEFHRTGDGKRNSVYTRTEYIQYNSF